MQFDRVPQFGNLQNRTAIGFQDSRDFLEESGVIGDVFYERYGDGDCDGAGPDGQPFGKCLYSQGFRFDRMYEGEAV